MEELGVVAVAERIVGFYPLVSGRGNYVFKIVYSGRIIEGNPIANRSEGIDDVRAFSLGEVRVLDKRKELRGANNLTALEDFFARKTFPLDIIRPISDK